jgi:hypothetical protein
MDHLAIDQESAKNPTDPRTCPQFPLHEMKVGPPSQPEGLSDSRRNFKYDSFHNYKRRFVSQRFQMGLGVTMQNAVWLDSLDEGALVALLPSVPGLSGSEDMTFEDLGSEYSISASIDKSQFGFGGEQIWEAAKREFRTMLCQRSDKYKDLQDDIGSYCKHGVAAVVTGISASLSPVIGVPAASVAPLISILLLATLRLGRNTMCSAVFLDHPVHKK